MNKTAKGEKPGKEKGAIVRKCLELPSDLYAKIKLDSIKRGIPVEEALTQALFRSVNRTPKNFFSKKVASPKRGKRVVGRGTR